MLHVCLTQCYHTRLLVNFFYPIALDTCIIICMYIYTEYYRYNALLVQAIMIMHEATIINCNTN